MSLALFDLDNTLIAGDSDYAWGQFLVQERRVDPEYYGHMNERFFRDYQKGVLDIMEYLRFALAPLAAIDPLELLGLRQRFVDEVIAPMWLPEAEDLIRRHREAGDRLLIVTATNRFIVEPICHRFGIADIIATEPEQLDGRYTGEVVGVPSYRAGKVQRLRQWLARVGETLNDSCFYSDSISDLPLLELVDKPAAVNPDAELEAIALERGWLRLDLRGGSA